MCVCEWECLRWRSVVPLAFSRCVATRFKCFHGWAPRRCAGIASQNLAVLAHKSGDQVGSVWILGGWGGWVGISHRRLLCNWYIQVPNALQVLYTDNNASRLAAPEGYTLGRQVHPGPRIYPSWPGFEPKRRVLYTI